MPSPPSTTAGSACASSAATTVTWPRWSCRGRARATRWAPSSGPSCRPSSPPSTWTRRSGRCWCGATGACSAPASTWSRWPAPSARSATTEAWLRRGRRSMTGCSRCRRPSTAVEACRKPVVAAVHGWCIGGGVDLIAACDIRLAAADAKFSVREVKVAIVADMGSLQRLPAIIGEGMTRRLAFTGEDIDATRAEQIGLVSDVYPDQRHAAGRRPGHVSRRCAANPPLVVQGTKRVLNASPRCAPGGRAGPGGHLERRVHAEPRPHRGDDRLHGAARADVRGSVADPRPAGPRGPGWSVGEEELPRRAGDERQRVGRRRACRRRGCGRRRGAERWRG